jgi:hypothetical protein
MTFGLTVWIATGVAYGCDPATGQGCASQQPASPPQAPTGGANNQPNPQGQQPAAGDPFVPPGYQAPAQNQAPTQQPPAQQPSAQIQAPAAQAPSPNVQPATPQGAPTPTSTASGSSRTWLLLLLALILVIFGFALLALGILLRRIAAAKPIDRDSLSFFVGEGGAELKQLEKSDPDSAHEQMHRFWQNVDRARAQSATSDDE